MIIKANLEQTAEKLGANIEDVKILWMEGVVQDNGYKLLISKTEQKFMLLKDFNRLIELNNELKSEYLKEDYTEKEISQMVAEKELLATKKYTTEEAFSLLK